MAGIHASTRAPLKILARVVPASAVLFAFVLLASGRFRSLSGLGWWEAAAVVGLLIGLAWSAFRRWANASRNLPNLFEDDLELGGCLIAATFVLVSLGGFGLYPLVYLLMAFLVAFLPRGSALTLVAVAAIFDGLLTLLPPHTDLERFGIHVAFIVLFAVLYETVLSARLAWARKAEREAVSKRIREVEERARTFRLVSSGSKDSLSGLEAEEKWLLASVKEIESRVGAALEIGEVALDTHTCGAFLLASDDRSLRLHDARSASERVCRGNLPVGEGILGGVLKRRAAVRIASAQPLKGVTHYEPGGPDVRAVLAVPIVESSGQVRGVLVADRLEHRPFTDRDEGLLTTLAGEVLRAIEVERVMSYIRKTRDEKDRFFRAIEELNRAGSPDEVFDAVLDSARSLGGLDFAAVTLSSEVDGKRTHKIARMLGITPQSKAIEGKVFDDNAGLVSHVVRYGAPLPGKDPRALDKRVIFDREIQIRGLRALKIFPLTAGDRILGTLVAGTRKKGLGEEVLRMLEVLAIQAAQAVLRAQLFEQMEKMATTDGLTGLLNHRTFQSRASELLAQARRYGRPCALILTDIDHFKSVNDTYGHPTGDQVLQGVAKILREQARDTDVVARYGGEEFVVVMPETDVKGAKVIAERIREAIASRIFQTELGPLRVTLSLGIACCPDDGTEKQPLIDLSDQCLYFAKEHGRNQSVTVAQMRGGRKARPAEAQSA